MLHVGRCLRSSCSRGPAGISLESLAKLFYLQRGPYAAAAGRLNSTALVSAEELAACRPPAQYLECLDEMVSIAGQRPSLSGKVHTRRMPNQMGELPCNSCGRYFEMEAFARTRTVCKDCSCMHASNHYRTLRGFVLKMLTSARARAKRKGLTHNLQLQDVLNMLLKQGGRCAYSGIAMEMLVPFSHWRMSLERLDNSEGYVKDNCALVAAEFNSPDYSRCKGVRAEDIHGTAQWSSEKVCMVGCVDTTAVSLSQLEADVGRATRRPNISTAFGDYHRSYIRTLRGKAKSLANNARNSSSRRQRTSEIEYTDILQMLLKQGGRCFYSGIPLQYDQPHVDWAMSLERLNNSCGYVRDNCVLIAAEFNTTDLSKNAKGEVYGSSQWSRAKVMHVWGQAGCDRFSQS
ncbi:unnamed protein product [Symbiodinium sp. CCMP2592]|nr:unnamed protein product [Symbiodinium sp. CCMP2592]